jgi:LysR family transcriptional regulator, regulator for bpeEF and oprC
MTCRALCCSSPKGRLRIDVAGSLASLFLIPKLPAFVERYPEIQVEIGVSDRPLNLISENVDCVIRGGPLTEQSLVARH